MKLFTEAAETGDAQAQVRIGDLYRDGKGAPQNDVEAVKWYRLAAEQGNAQGQIDLGTAYKHGNGVPQDYVLAHMWFNLASADDDFPAGRGLARMQRDLVANDMTRDQIAEAQRLAREWKPKKQAAGNH